MSFYFGKDQQQQHQQMSNFSQSATNDLKTSSFGQFTPSTGTTLADPFKSASNSFTSFSAGSFTSSTPCMTSSQTSFGFPSTFPTSIPSSTGFQAPNFPQFTNVSNPPTFPGQDIGKQPLKSVFANFFKPAGPKVSEPAALASAPSRSYCTFFQKGACRNGESCPYLHEIQPNAHAIAEGPPKFVLSNLNANPEPRLKAMTNHEPRVKAICRYFLAGACLKGDSCKFLHDTRGSEDHHSAVVSAPVDAKTEAVPALSPPAPEGLFTRKASPTHAATVTFQSNSVPAGAQAVKFVESSTLVSPKEEPVSEPPSDEALISARSRRFRNANSLLPEAPTPVVSTSDDLIDEEEPEFASGSACIVGTLMTMCSQAEIRKRDLEMDVHILESIQDDTITSRTARRADPEKMVKKYQRSAAGMHAATPSEVRPPIVLAKTIDYLFNNVLDSILVPPLDVYNFLRDRFRAIRKDFALQDQAETLAATVHEQIARYFILSHHELCEEKEDDFQKFQNLQQISHTITSLNHYYKDLHLKNGIATPSEAEFYSYQILLNVRDANKLNDRLMNIPAHIRSAPLICVARELVASFRGLNYARFFRILKTRATYLQRCCVHGFLWGFRSRALKVVYNGMGAVQSTFPLQSLIEILAFDDLNEALHFCEAHGITVANNEMVKAAFPIEEEVKVEWMRSRILIGPPKPSRKAVIMGDLTAPALSEQQSVLDVQAQERQERLRIEREEQDRKKAEAQQRLKELAAKQKEEALQLHLNKLETLLIEFGLSSTRRKKLVIFRKWCDLAKSFRDRRADEKRRKQLQIAQQKFSEQKTYLTALSKVARLFLTHVWLNRWRSRTWNRRRADMIATLFRKHIWFRKWNRGACRIRQFKRLARSNPATSDAFPVRSVYALPAVEQKPSFMQLLVESVNNNPNRPRSDLHVRVAVSIPALRYSDAVRNRVYSDFQICNSVLKMLSIDEKPVFDSKVILYGGFSLDLRIIRTVAATSEPSIQGLFFLVSYQDTFQPSTNSELLRLRTLAKLNPNVPVVVLYSGDSPDPSFEQMFRSRLPPYSGDQLSFANISSESNLANLLAEIVQWFIINKIHEPTSSFVTLENVIRLRCKEIVSLEVGPVAVIPIFNKALFDIAQSISTQGCSDDELEQLCEARTIIHGYDLPEVLILRSGSVQDGFAELAAYVRANFPGIIASEPILSRMLVALSEGANTSGLLSVIINIRVDSLLLELYSRGLHLLLCANVAPLSIDRSALTPISTAIPTDYSNGHLVDRSQMQAKKRNRDAGSGPSIRDLKRKLLGTDRSLFSQKVDELLAKISR